MAEIIEITREHKMWNKTILFAELCSWSAGTVLAGLMKNNQFLHWERVFIACENGNIIGYCTLTQKDELSEEYEFTPFIGFVFVDERQRGRRISEMLISKASKYANEIGYSRIYVMSGEKGLYEKYGFEKIGEYETIYGWTDQLFERRTTLSLT